MVTQPHDTDLFNLLDKAEKLASQFHSGYSGQFLSAEEFHLALSDSIRKLKKGDRTQLDKLRIWFLPTSCWDDFIGTAGQDLANQITETLSKYLAISNQKIAEPTKWDELVIKAILSNEDFNILEVKHYESIKSLLFNREEYSSVFSLINKRDWESLQSLRSIEKIGFGEYLYIIKFSSQDEKNYVATVYDSDELWQDPEIIQIIPLT